MKRTYYLLLIFCLLLTQSFRAVAHQNLQTDTVKLLGVNTIPFGQKFNKTIIGGLSGIDRAEDGTFYIITDDRSEYSSARFYHADIKYSQEGIDTIIWLNTYPILRADGTVFPDFSVDPESIRISPENTLYYTSEGDRKLGIAPFVREMRLDGTYIRELTLPECFSFGENRGMHHNGALESLSLSDDKEYIWIMNEEPLIEDGPRADIYPTRSPLRLSLMNRNTGKLLHQFVYELGPIPAAPKKEFDFKVNSVPEILAVTNDQVLIMERAYVKDVGNFVKVFLCEIGNATDVKNISSLANESYVPIKSKVFIDFSKYPIKPDNIEGVSWGDVLPNGNRTLIFVSDDNFNESQKTQFWLFEVHSKQ